MNERELFAAYRNSTVENDRVFRPNPTSIKCLVDSCMTMIPVLSGRTICRFHEGKIRRGET